MDQGPACSASWHVLPYIPVLLFLIPFPCQGFAPLSFLFPTTSFFLAHSNQSQQTRHWYHYCPCPRILRVITDLSCDCHLYLQSFRFIMYDGLVYGKLATETTVRLIRVLPILVNDRIVCEILFRDLVFNPELNYRALSYQWGDPTPVKEIYLRVPQQDLLLIRVHENLWQFLHQIQVHATSDPVQHKWSDLLIWTDSLSLNQTDKEEISQQVPRMGQIYSQAAEVLIWLGNGGATQNALNRLRDDSDGKFNSNIVSRVPSLYRIASLEYWSRVWVMQEVVLAKRALVMAGDVTMNFDALEKKLQIYDRDEVNAPGKYWATRSRGAMRLLELRVKYKAAKSKGRRMPLWRVISIVYAYDDTRCTRSADAVYGLLGLIGYQKDAPSSEIYIAVDYGKSQVEVLFDTIFEVRAPVRHYWDQLKHLCYALRPMTLRWYEDEDSNRITYPNLGSTPVRPLDLEKYLKSKKAPEDQHYERHKDFAGLALKVYNAAIILAYTIGYRRWFNSATSLLKSGNPDDNDQDVLTPRQQAAVVGFALAMEASDMSPSPKYGGAKYPEQQLKISSPWRCASGRVEHKVQAPEHQPSPSLTLTWSSVFGVGDRRHLEWICGEHDSSCDPSEVSFKIAEIGFRLVISTASEHDPQPQFEDDQGDGGAKVYMSMHLQSSNPVSTYFI